MAPRGVDVDRTSGTTMTVSWSPLDLTLKEARGFIHYRVIYDSVSSQRKRQETCSSSPCEVSGDSDSVEITGLDPDTAYIVTVRGVNNADNRLEGPLSDPVIAEGKYLYCYHCSHCITQYHLYTLLCLPISNIPSATSSQ